MIPVADQDERLRAIALFREPLSSEGSRGDRLFPKQVLDVFGGGLTVGRPGVERSGQQNPPLNLFQRNAQADPEGHLAAQLGQKTHLAAQQILAFPTAEARNHPAGPKPLQFPEGIQPGQGVPTRQFRPRSLDDHPARKQNSLSRQVEGCRCGFKSVIAGDRFDASRPLPERDCSPRPGNLNHFNTTRPERLQRFVFRIRFAGEQQRANRLGAGSSNCGQECFHSDPMRQVDQHRPVFQLDPTAVGRAVAVGKPRQVDAGSELLDEIQGSCRAAAGSHKETSDQWARIWSGAFLFHSVSAVPSYGTAARLGEK